MAFEIGKFYKHTTGESLAIVGELETTMWGKCLIAEASRRGSHELVPVGRSEACSVNYIEISEDEWMSNFCND